MTERGMSEGEKTVFIVKKGESPYSIGKRMEEEGLLPKDAGFDRYLVDHGYDTKVVAAEYEIPADADMDTMIPLAIKGVLCYNTIVVAKNTYVHSLSVLS